MKFGQFEILPFVEQTFRLDGGTMYGVVPKKIWNKLTPSDENNLVAMQTNLFVLKTKEYSFLFDTGFGDVLSEREKKIYAVDKETNLLSGLQKVGLKADDIDFVFLSHLHTDHAGGAVKLEDGNYMPRFTNAKYIVQKREWDDAMSPNERTTAVYIPERLGCLENQLMLIDGDEEIFPGIKVKITGGHTPGHQAIECSSEGSTVVYYADIVPSSHHVRIPYVAAVDLDPVRVMDVKRALVSRLLDENMAIVFDHDTEVAIGKLSQNDKKIIVDKIE